MFNNGTTTTSAVIDFMKNDVVVDEWNFSTNNRTSTSYSAMGGKDINQLYFKVYAGVSIDVTIKPMFTNNGQLPSEFKPHMICHDIFHYIHNTDIDTITTFPAVIYSNDMAATVGLKGNMLQTGTPSPTTPIQPSECGMTVNVMPFASAQTIVNNGVTFVSDGTGRYTVNGTATEDASADFDIPEFTIPVSVDAGGHGTFSLFNDSFGNNAGNVIEFYNNTTLIDAWSLHFDNRTSTTYVGMGGKKCNRIRIVVKSGVSIDHKSVKPMFTNDSTLPTNYESYGYKILISSAGQTTPVYLGEIETMRQIKKLVLDGTEDWTQSSTDVSYNRYKIIISNMKAYGTRLTPLYCTHYQNVSDGRAISDVPNNSIYTGSGVDTYIKDTTFSSIIDFKSYLAAQYAAGTPVCVWYVLATPETGIINEPIRKIGDYADEVSGITIPVTTGANTLSVDTTIQPSEVTVSYKGWHPVQSVHEKSKNLFDKSKKTDNSRVVYTTGEIGALFGVFVSDFTPIEPDTTYTLNIVSNISDKTGHLFALYDKNKNFVDTGTHEVSWQATVYTFTTPSNVSYIRFNGNMSSVDSTMFNEGGTSLPYEPYWK